MTVFITCVVVSNVDRSYEQVFVLLLIGWFIDEVDCVEADWFIKLTNSI